MIKDVPRVLIVGCGAHMTTSLLPALHAAGLGVAACCDPDPERAGAVARAHGVPAFGSLEEALAATPCAGAVIAVSREKNGALARACIERGLPTFIEKPPAATAAEAREIAALAAQRGVATQVGFMKRCAPSYNRARRIAASPAFGGPRMLCLEASAGPYGSLESFMFDYGIHYLDLALHLCGPAAQVRAVCPRRAGGGEPAATQVLLSFASGAVGSLTFAAGAGWHEPCERLTLYGAGMRVEVANVAFVRWFRGAPPDKPGPGDDAALVWEPNLHLPQLEMQSLALQGYLHQMRQFRLSLAMRLPPPATLDSAVATMELVEAVLESASKKGVTEEKG